MNNDAQLDLLIRKMAEDHRPELPSPGVIWWRAHIQKKFAEKERIERPMAIMRQLAAVVWVVALLFLLVTYGKNHSSGIASFDALLPLGAAAGVALLAGGFLVVRVRHRKA